MSAHLKAVPHGMLMKLYNDSFFLPAMRLTEMEERGLGRVAAVDDGTAVVETRSVPASGSQARSRRRGKKGSKRR